MTKGTKKAKARIPRKQTKPATSMIAALKPDPNYVKLLGAGTGSQAKA